MQDEIIIKEIKKNKINWKIFGIVMAVLAACGVVFGIAMIIRNNTMVVAECEEKQDGGGAASVPVDTRESQLIAAEAPRSYTLSMSSAVFNVGDSRVYLNLKWRDGEIVECKRTVQGGGGTGNCQIDGINGKIYKIEKMRVKSGELGSMLGLIMSDGTVEYVRLEGVSGSTYNVAGTLKIDGFVTDLIGANVRENEYVQGSEWNTLFVLSGGKIVEFDTAMLGEV